MTNSERLYYEQLIKQLSGKNFNLNKFPDNQIYAMYIKYKNNPIQQKQSILKQNRFTYLQYNTKPNRCTFCNSQLTDAGECPICDLGEEHYNENIKEGNIMNKEWKLVKVKQVYDSDGFLTDYTWYTDGNTHIMMFGDNEIYEPDIDYADYVTEDEEEASDWFDFYETEDEEETSDFYEIDENMKENLDEGLDEYVEIASLNFQNPFKNNRLPGIQNERDLAKAFEETGKTKFKININKLKNVSISDIRDTFGGNYFKRHFGWTASLHNENGKYYLYVTKILNESAKTKNESSYGGAYDIIDDEYFTRHDLNDMGDTIVDHLSETFNSEFERNGEYIEDGIFNIIISDDLSTYESAVKIDMRKIKKPSDLKSKYALIVAADLINQIKRTRDDVFEGLDEFDDELNEAYITDYIDSEKLQTIMNSTTGFANFDSYDILNNMVIRTYKHDKAFPGADKLIDINYYKFINDGNNWIAVECDSNGIVLANAKEILIDNSLLEDFNLVYEIEYTDRESGEEALRDTIKGKDQADAIDKYFKNPKNASNEITKITAKNNKKLDEVAPIIAAAAGAAISSFANKLGNNLADKITESTDDGYTYQVGDIVVLNGKDREKARVTDILDNNYYEVEVIDSKEVYNVGDDEILYALDNDEELTEDIEEYQVDGVRKIDKDTETLCTIDEKDVIIEDVEKAPPAPALPGKDSGIANILIALIQSEWTAIDDYNNAIASLAAYNEDEMINVLEDIIAEENVHVGQLLKVLDTIAPNTKGIDEGTKEAEQQLNEPSEIVQQIQDGN